MYLLNSLYYRFLPQGFVICWSDICNHFQFGILLFKHWLDQSLIGVFFNAKATAWQRLHLGESRSLKTIYYRPFWFYIFISNLKGRPRFLHNIGDNQCDASRYSGHTMDQHIGSLPFIFNEFKAVLEKYRDVAWFMVNHRDIQVLDMFGNFIVEIFALDCSNDSPNVVLWIK